MPPIEQDRPWLASAIYYALVLVAALTWRWYSFAYPTHLGYDEAIYQRYAQTLGEQGLSGFREVIAIWPTDGYLRVGPPPFRPFWILSSMFGCKLLGGYSTQHIVLVAALFGFATILTGAVLARRWFGFAQGLAISLLLVVSPLADAMSRRGLQDTCFAFMLVLCALLLDRCWRSGKSSDVAALFTALVAGFLTKESMLFFYPAFAAACLIYASDIPWRERRGAIAAFAAAPVVALLVLLWFAGGWDALSKAYATYADIPRNPYAAQFQRGPWFRYLVDFMLLSPLTMMLAPVGAASLSRASSAGAKLACAYALVGIAGLSLLPTFNARFALGLDAFLRMLAMVGVVHLSARMGTESRARAAAIALVMLIAASDVTQFNRIFVTGDVYDPVTAELTRANAMAPH